MIKYVDAEIELTEQLWELLEHLAERRSITVNELINDILSFELDKMEAYEYLNKDNSGGQMGRI